MNKFMGLDIVFVHQANATENFNIMKWFNRRYLKFQDGTIALAQEKIIGNDILL